MPNNENVAGKTKSPEELAEAAALAVIEAAEKRAEDSDAMEKGISDLEAQIKQMQKMIADSKRRIGRNRKFVLYTVQKQFFESVVKQLGYESKIKECKSPSDFKKVTDEMLEKILPVKNEEDNAETKQKPEPDAEA